MSLIPFGFWGTRNYSREGLKLYYDFASSSSYPGTGSTVYNLAKNDFNGTINGATYDGSDSGGCFDFDGVDDRIEPSPVSFFNNEIWGPNQTWEFWFKTTKTTEQMRLIGLFDTLATPVNFTGHIQVTLNQGINSYQNGAVYVHVRDNIGTTTWRERRASSGSNVGVIDGNWHQIIGTWENTDTYVSNANYTTQFRIYIDGVELSSYQLSGESAINNNAIQYSDVDFVPWIGAANSRGSLALYPFDGKIGVVRGYNRSLSDTEILLNFNQYKDRYGL